MCYGKKSASTALLNGQILTDFPGQVLDDSAICVTAPCWIDGGHNAIPNTTYQTDELRLGALLSLQNTLWLYDGENQCLRG